MSVDLDKEIPILIKKFDAGMFSDVINKTIIFLKKNNNDFLWNLLGLCYQNIHQNQKSIKCFENSIDLNSKNLAAINNLALSHKKLKNYSQSENYLKQLLIINPKYLNALVNMGNLKNETYFFDEAISYYEKAISVDKNIPLIYLNIANVYRTINKIEDAKKNFKKALKIDPTFTIADQKLSLLEKYNKKNQHLDEMLKKLETIKLTDKQKISLYFAIAKGFEDLDEYDKSFHYLNKGNVTQRNLLKYDIENHRNFCEKIKNIFSNLDVENYKEDEASNNKIFILGMPRSGTTLVEKIISSHTQVSTVSETNFLPEKIFSKIYKNLDPKSDIFKSFIEGDFAKQYNDFLKSFNVNSNLVIDKTLTNYYYLGFIKIFFPKSKVIHVHRNAKDNCLSIYKNIFDTPEGWNCDQNELAEYYLIYKDLMKYWNKLYSGFIHNIRYEDLIINTNNEVKELISFCGLEWENKCLEYYKNDNPIKTVSFNQANKPIYKSSIKKYELYEKNLSRLFSKLN
jgi:hypothetical protein